MRQNLCLFLHMLCTVFVQLTSVKYYQFPRHRHLLDSSHSANNLCPVKLLEQDILIESMRQGKQRGRMCRQRMYRQSRESAVKEIAEGWSLGLGNSVVSSEKQKEVIRAVVYHKRYCVIWTSQAGTGVSCHSVSPRPPGVEGVLQRTRVLIIPHICTFILQQFAQLHYCMSHHE